MIHVKAVNNIQFVCVLHVSVFDLKLCVGTLSV